MLPNQPDAPLSEAPLGEHFDELRRALLRALLLFFCVGALIWSQLGRLAFLIEYPYQKAIQNFDLPSAESFIATNVFDVLSVNVKLTFFLSFHLLLPYLIWEVWRFLSKGLYPEERTFCRTLAFAFLGCFYTGLFLCYFFLMPFILKQAIQWTLKFASPLFSVASYLKVLMGACIAFGLLFEIPVFLGAAAYFGWLPPETLQRNRKWMLLLSLIASALIGPPDVVSQITLASPIFLLFEVSIWVMVLLRHQRSRFLLSKKASKVEADVPEETVPENL